MRKMIAVGLAVGLLTSCGEVDDAASATATSASTIEAVPGEGGSSLVPSTAEFPTTTTKPKEAAPETSGLPGGVAPDTSPPTVGEVGADLLADVRRDLETRTGATEDDISIIRAEEVIWIDGSLGCAEPGEVYTQATVKGFWIVLDHAGQQYDYRGSDSGYFKLCEGTGVPPTNPTG